MSEKHVNIEKSVINIGLEKPVSILHLSDTHFCAADEFDSPAVQGMAARRLKNAFRDTDGVDRIRQYWDESIAYAKENSLPVIHTGDLIDFLSHGNAVLAKQLLSNVDYFFAAGNHEFCHYVGRAREDLAYKMEQLFYIQPSINYNLLFASRVIGGINFISVDNGYYLVADWQRECLEREVAKGLPIVLIMHNPIHTDALYDVMMSEKKQPCAYLMGTPEEMMRSYAPDRYKQQLADEPTRRFIDYLSKTPLVRAVLTGHLHFNYHDMLPWGIPQYVTGGGFLGDAREITFI